MYTRFYEDKCPHCGTYINIIDATVCPGCNARLFWGPDPSDLNAKGLYYSSQEEREIAIKKKVDAIKKETETAFTLGAGMAVFGMFIWGEVANFKMNFFGIFGLMFLAAGLMMAFFNSD